MYIYSSHFPISLATIPISNSMIFISQFILITLYSPSNYYPQNNLIPSNSLLLNYTLITHMSLEASPIPYILLILLY